ncbi:hypothetical protein [Planctomycetes bacterium K23_9]|uniref:Uncharacterized protein n=1 Tax=Stieleria marina TaxID=1930275 RepID=A0A517NWV6_9BACT|nr:hypothetical protein K239x_36170 [Planctomycetes bacterium K23_9]
MQDGGNMSVRKLTAGLLTALALLGGFGTVQANDLLTIADPFEFDPDFRWFEPTYQLDLEDMKPKQRAHYGWFGTYDRMALFTSRPELDDPDTAENKLDGGWGHRYEVGFMSDSGDKGWTFNWTRHSVGKYITNARERVNRLDLDELAGTPANPDPIFGFTTPQGDGNTRGYNTRTYFIQDSENVLNYNAYELNRTWRMEAYHYGGILEPMLGLRYMKVSDINTVQNYRSSIDPIAPFLDFGDAAEELVTDNTTTDNDILAGQFGFRYTKHALGSSGGPNRFTFIGDFRVFTGASLQCSTSYQDTEITIYDGATAGDEVTNVLNRQATPTYARNEEFTIGFDARAQLSYQLTKAISLRGGVQVIDIATGVWRGGPELGTHVVDGRTERNRLEGGDRDQDVVMAGFTFGLSLNH